MGKNQHIIPVFYQKYWECDRSGYVWALDKRYNGSIRQRSITHNCSCNYFYEGDVNNPNDAFENWYSQFEDKFAPQYARLINGRFCIQRVDNNTKKMICSMYANLSARNNYNLYLNDENRRLAGLFTLGFPDKETDCRNILNIIALSNGDVIDSVQSRFSMELMSLKLQILVSDRPIIIFCDCIMEQIHYSNEFFFPICPTMVACFTKEEDAVDGRVRAIKECEYQRFIDLYVTSSYVSQVFSSQKSTLERIQHLYNFFA